MSRPTFTPEELEAMRLADEEVDREFDESVSAAVENEQMDKWLDELVVMDCLDNKQLHQRRYRQKYSRAYYEEHREELAAKMRAYREEHREELAAKMRAYREEHREELAAKKRAYYEEHREELAAKMRAYYEEHREELAAKMRAYREEHREELAAKMRAYREEHREEYKAYQREYYRTHKGRRRRANVLVGGIAQESEAAPC